MSFFSLLFVAIIIFLLFVQIKTTLFWLYLWQLKEYHLARFFDHFRTDIGKKIIFNKIIYLKIILVFILFFFAFWANQEMADSSFYFLVILILALVYFFQTGAFFKNLLARTLKKPVFTKKALFLSSCVFLLQVIIVFWRYFKSYDIYYFIFWLAFLNILTPSLVCSVVLMFQPIAVLLRNRIIKKASQKRSKFKNLLAIGITGSYGKTSTKEILRAILEEKFNVLTTKEHQNSEIGISKTILNDLNESHQIFVAEMGAYGKGGIKMLCKIVQPKIGMLTGINQQHMALFGSQENIIKTKFELVDCLPANGLVIFNWDNEHIKEMARQRNFFPEVKVKRRCSVNEKLDIWIQDAKIEKQWISCKIFSKDGDFADFKINLLGGQNLQNLLLAVSCAKELGMSLEEIAKACLKIKQEQGAMKILENEKGLNIIDSSYSANPEGVIADLDYLKNWKGKKIIIMPCLIELGASSGQVHKNIGKKIARICDFAIITTKERFEDIKKGAVENEMPEKNILFIENPEKIWKKIANFCDREDVILLEGRVPSKLIKIIRSVKEKK